MNSSRRILFGVIVLGLVLLIGIWLSRSRESSSLDELSFIEVPVQFAQIGGVVIEEGDPISLVVTINCTLSSLPEGCSSKGIFASMGDCNWTDAQLTLQDHLVYSSGYETGSWELVMWGEGPLWISAGEQLPSECSDESINARRLVGSIHISRRPYRD